MALDNDVDCDPGDVRVVSKTTFYNVASLSRLTYRRGYYGGWEVRIVAPSRATESKGRHNEYSKQKINFVCSQEILNY
jgi:hypothetical protein